MSFTDFKEVTGNNPGTSIRYGGNDLKDLMQILNGKIVSNKRPKILNDWIFLDHVDIKAPGSAPSAPTDINTNRLYTDPSDFKLKIRKTSGTIVDLEALPPTGGDVFLNQTNTFGDFDNTFRSSRLRLTNPANTAAYYFLGAAIAGHRNITLPLLTANDTLVTAAFLQTLTNKTIDVDSNTVKHSVTNAAGDLLKGTGTKFDRLARGTANQILAVNAGGTDIAWITPAGGGNVSTTSSNTYGDFDQIFRSGRVDIMNPANTFAYSVVGSAITAARNLILPLITADDTLVTTDVPQTFVNKTVNVDTNTVKHGATNAAGDLLRNTGTKFDRFAKGTANQVLFVNATATDIEWRTHTAPPGTSFLPDVANSGQIWGLWTGGAKSGTGLWSGATTFGTVTGKQDSTTNTKTTTEFVTGTITGNTSGFQGFQPTTAGFYTARNQNFHFKARFQFTDVLNKRLAIGLAGVGSLPATTDTYLATSIPGFLFRFSSTTDATLKLLRNDNAGTAITVDTTVTVAANTPITIDIFGDEPNTRMGWAINGGATTWYTTDIPANTQGLNYFNILETKSAAAQRMQLYYAYLTQDPI